MVKSSSTVLTQIFILVCIICIIGLFSRMHEREATYVKSDFDGKEYFVQNTDGREDAAHLLGMVNVKITILKNYLKENKAKYPEFEDYINQLYSHTNNLVLYENKPGSKYTSYTINKGEEMALCLRSKNGTLHDINLITYVVLHELAHIACPEIDHTELFKKIFKFFIEVAVQINIYTNVNYKLDPVEYCGMIINENLVKS